MNQWRNFKATATWGDSKFQTDLDGAKPPSCDL